MHALFLICVLSLVNVLLAFNHLTTSKLMMKSYKSGISMEYIPDGLTKAQWAQIKKKEEEEKKAKGDQAVMGTKRFKSRSFEAWQKAGGIHLFPVDPNETSYEERPYMQRKGGDWEGSDLKARGLQGKGQGKASGRVDLDDLYEKAKKAGKLDSASIFGGANLPWTSEAANKISNNGPASKEKELKNQPKAVAAKPLTPEEMKRLKANLFKPIVTEKKDNVTPAAEPKKKLFGLF